MDNNDLHWLAGYLEGEGSFLSPPPSSPRMSVITASSTDEDVIKRVAALLGVAYCQYRRDKRNRRWKIVYSVRRRGSKAVVLMKQLRPLMGVRRRSQIDKALEGYVRIERKAPLCGSNSRYSKGCRCCECREAHRVTNSKYPRKRVVSG